MGTPTVIAWRIPGDRATYSCEVTEDVFELPAGAELVEDPNPHWVALDPADWDGRRLVQRRDEPRVPDGGILG